MRSSRGWQTTSTSRRQSSRALQQRLFLMLQSCKRRRQVAQLHAQLLVNGFAGKSFLVTKLLSSCIASGELAHAARAFEQVEEPSTTLSNQMIRAFSRSATPCDSLLLFARARMSSPPPNSFTYAFLLAACARAGPPVLSQGQQLHGRVLTVGFGSNVYVQTNLVNMYAASSKTMEMARKVFDEMTHRNLVSWNTMLAGFLRSGDTPSAFRFFDRMPKRDAVSWTTIIAGCAQAGRCRQALQLFREMRRVGVKADQVTLVTALSACADVGDLELGRWIHARIVRGEARRRPQEEERPVSLDNALIHMYARCGAVDDALQVFQEMPRRSTVSWTSMIAGLAANGRGGDALDLFRRILQQEEAGKEKPDGPTLLAVLCACSYVGKIEEGRRCVEHMTRLYGIRPSVQHYGCMIDMLSRAGRLHEACELLETMPMPPNEAVWGALLGGCRIHLDVELASKVVDRLMELLQPQQAAGYLVLLSNVFAAANKWDDARTVRERMVELAVSKPAGRSLIHVPP